jgi:hypothetical protein
MPIPPLVRGLFSPAFVLFSLLSLHSDPALLQGKWQCRTLTGRLDSTTLYQMNCEGYVQFKADNLIESTCSDGFFPAGAQWALADGHLLLKDSHGRSFADYIVKKLDERHLVLLRKNVSYTFEKVE